MMPRIILRLQKDGNVTEGVISQIEGFIDDKEEFFDTILFERVDQEEEITILREKGV